jgi:hypothetical protein
MIVVVALAAALRSTAAISSAPAESGMAHLVNHRMGKKQSMRWFAEGAHQLLQVRCAVLDGQLESFFREWFTGFRDGDPYIAAQGSTYSWTRVLPEWDTER